MPESGLFGDLIEQLRTYQDLFNDYSNSITPFVERISQTLEWKVAKILIENARASMRSIPEYSTGQAQRLVSHLIENLSASRSDGGPVHVRLSPDFGFEIFDEEYAGTYEDLKAGQPESGDPDKAAFYWKFGIYKPSVEGYVLTITKKTKSGTKTRQIRTVPYSKVLSERLAAWGSKAPYWFFIEHGNQGSGREYPTFGGKPFIYPTEVRAREELRLFEQDIMDLINEQLQDDLEFFWGKAYSLKGGGLAQRLFVRSKSGKFATRFAGAEEAPSGSAYRRVR